VLPRDTAGDGRVIVVVDGREGTRVSQSTIMAWRMPWRLSVNFVSEKGTVEGASNKC